MKTCDTCRYPNSDDSMFCIGCGAKLTDDLPNSSQTPPQPFDSQAFQTQPQQFDSQAFQTQPQQFDSQAFQTQPQQFDSQAFQTQQPQQFQSQPFQLQQPQQFQSQSFQQQPAQSQLPQPRSQQPITKKWWFWVVIGVVATGLIVSTVFIVRHFTSKEDQNTAVVDLPGSSGSTNSSGSTKSSGSAKPTEPSDSSGSSTQQATVLKVGETLTVSQDGKPIFKFTVNSAKATDYRNNLNDNHPNQVVIINFTYENIALEEDLYIYDSRFRVIDGDGNVCDTYSYYGSSKLYSQKTPMGAKCTAEEAYGLLSDKGDFKLMLYDESYNGKAIGTFELTVE